MIHIVLRIIMLLIMIIRMAFTIQRTLRNIQISTIPTTPMFTLLSMEGSIRTTTTVSNRLASAEQFTVAACNLDCKYCYIPKSDSMKSLNKEVVKELGRSSWLDRLESVYGKNLTHFGFWGAEPTLTLGRVPFQKLFERFPNLRELSFSTNLMTEPRAIAEAIKQLNKICTKEALFKIQVSLDGPAYITDINRKKGAAEKIPKNIHLLVIKLNGEKLKKVRVEIRMKSTLTMENIKLLNAEPEKVKEYFNYFSQIEKDFQETNKNNRVGFVNSCSPTL